MENAMVVLGFVAQGLFTARFLVQWICSERAGRSVVPLTFWFLSVGGGALLLAYSIWREDPVFIVGQAAGLVVYFRNLRLIYREGIQAKIQRVSV
ncbi:MAG: lipid-A-disaccharide synthase N-terminal domain-containing protein [Syntrophobacteraceae bacterium]